MREEHPLFGPLDPDLCQDLAVWASAMLERHLTGEPERLQQALSDISRECGSLADFRSHQPRPFRQIRIALRGLKKKAPVSAFLVEECSHGGPAAALAGEALTAWVLAAVLRRRQRSRDQSAIRTGLDAARLLKKSAPSLLTEMSWAGSDMAQVAQQLRAMITRADQPLVVQRYCYSIDCLLRYTLDDREAITRQSTAREGRGTVLRGAALRGEDVPHIVSFPDERLGFLNSGDGEQGQGLSGSAAEQSADESSGRIWAVDGPSGKSYTPRRTAQRRLAAMVKDLSRRQLSLSAEADALTPLEISVLSQFCLERHDRTARGVFLRLVTGGGFRQSAQAGQGLVKDPEGMPFYALSVTLPDPGSLIEEGGEAPEADDQSLWLDLPADHLGATYPHSDWQEAVTVSDKEMQDALAALRGKVSRGFSLGRIRRYKADWLRAQGCDPVIVGFLTGELPAYRAQLHYTKLRRSELIWWHRRYLFALVGPRVQPFPDAPEAYGSRVALPMGPFAVLLAQFAKELIANRPSRDAPLSSVVVAHNLYATYTLILLYLATGHRPVGSPFERLGDMDFETGLIWISDKTSTNQRGARVLVLPELARAQLQFWCAHLARLQVRPTRAHNPRLEDRIRAALAQDPRAQQPLFFTLEPDGEVAELTTAKQRQLFEKLSPLPLNWSRHLLRSALTSSVDGQLIDAWMGHAHYAELPFKAASGLGIGDLRQVAHEINRMMRQNGISAQESPI